MSRAGLGEGPPKEPITPTYRGRAFALAAAAIDILTGHTQMITLNVDLINGVTITEDDLYGAHLTEPGIKAPEGSWSDMIYRLRSALDNQAWGDYDCTFMLDLKMLSQTEKIPVRVLMEVPWKIDLTCMPGRNPPVGKWRLLQQAQPTIETTEWWTDGTPF